MKEIMKKASPKQASRRKFLKHAVTGVVTTVACAKAPDLLAAAKPIVLGSKKRSNQSSKKIGPIKPQPRRDSAFADIDRRMPGWRPDTVDTFFTSDKLLYPEQLLKVRYGNHDPFGHVNANANILKEPPPDPPANAADLPAWQAKWLEFNTWVMGAPLNVINPSDFDLFLAEIGNRVRRYNSALYWMRRLHFHENDTPISKPPDYNENGDAYKDLPDLSTAAGKTTFQAWAKAAVAAWRKAVDDLNDILGGKVASWNDKGFQETNADMVEVNGYIVSMRVLSKCEEADTRGDVHALELGGSSSSHISISSAFSSPR